MRGRGATGIRMPVLTESDGSQKKKQKKKGRRGRRERSTKRLQYK